MSNTRDVGPCILAIRMVFAKFKEFPGKALKFVAYYNFLRPHSYSYWPPLNPIAELQAITNMPGKWQKLIELSKQFILSKQASKKLYQSFHFKP